MDKTLLNLKCGHLLYSFTRVTITEDCIEAEEYLEVDSNSATDENDVVKKLFSDDDEAVLSS